MKIIKLLLVTFLVTSAFTTSAQITKRNWMLGGDIAIEYGETKHNDTGQKGDRTDLRLNPKIGYFIVDKLALGANMSFHYNSWHFKNQPNNKYTESHFGPFVRYYLLEVENPLNIFLESSYQIHLNDIYDVDVKTFNTSLGTGYFLTNSVSLEAILRYSHIETSYGNSSGINYDNITALFGFQIHLERKR